MGILICTILYLLRQCVLLEQTNPNVDYFSLLESGKLPNYEDIKDSLFIMYKSSLLYDWSKVIPDYNGSPLEPPKDGIIVPWEENSKFIFRCRSVVEKILFFLCL